MSGLRPPKLFRRPRSRDVSEARAIVDSSNISVHTTDPSGAPATLASTSAPRDSGTGASLPSTPPLAGHSTIPNKIRKFKWKNLREFAKLSNLVGPFKAFADDLIECVHIYEDVSDNQEEFAVLQKELEGLFEELNGHIIPNASPVMTASVRNVCSCIQEEIEIIKSKEDRSGLKRAIEVGEDADEVLACYRRIRSHVRRLLLNINISMWKIVDEIAAENRLVKLSVAPSARYDSAQALEIERGECTPGTRISVFKTIFNWVDDPVAGYIYWLNGMAGTGKTTIAYSLCSQLAAKHRLAASFFCSQTLPECRDVSLIIPFIAYQLARFSRPFRFELQQVLEENPDAHTKLPHSQFDMLISRPLGQVRDPWPSNSVVVIDALDECDHRKGTEIILDILLTKGRNLPIKFFISGRPEPAIRDQMSKPLANQVSSRLVLHELDKHNVQMDIRIFIRAALSEIPDAPSEQQIATLAERAGVLFIYAATVLRYITHDGFGQSPRARLDMVLNRSGESTNKHKEIDELYATILKAALCDSKLDDRDKHDRKQVLYTVICAREPLTIPALSFLLKLDTYCVNAALRPLWSVLHVVESTNFVAPLHASFPDYMFDPTRSGEYYCNQGSHHCTLAQLCFECIERTQPQFNICGLESSYIPDHEVDDLDRRVEQAISAELFYACRYWAAHLISSNGGLNATERLECFLKNHFLLWMEVMNLKKCLDHGIQAVHAVEVWCRCPGHSSNILDLVHDAWRFAMTVASNRVSQSTPHIYVSVLPFWPAENPIAKHYAPRTRGMIKVTGTEMGPHQPLLGKWHLESDGGFTCIRCGAFSPDGTQFAVGMGTEVRILDSFYGRDLLYPLKGHWSLVTSVQYSPSGSYIASSSLDNTVRIWDVQSGKLLLNPLKFRGDTYHEGSLAFSPAGTNIAFGSDDRIYIWDIQNGALRCSSPTLGRVRLLQYSADANCLFGCVEIWPWMGVEIWDAQNGQTIGQLRTNFPATNSSLGWCPDESRIVFVCENTVYSWDTRSQQLAPDPLKIGDEKLGTLKPIGFSRDWTRILMSSTNKSETRRSSIYSFDLQNGQIVLGPLEGFSCRFATFSPDETRIVASELDSNTICVFDTYIEQQEAVSIRPRRSAARIHLARYSPDSAYIVSGVDSTSIAVWNARTGQMVLGPLAGHNDSITLVNYSHDGAHILSCSRDNTIRTWDARNGHNQLVMGPGMAGAWEGTHASACYSPDDTCIACAWSGDSAIYILNAHDGQTVLGPLHVDRSTWIQEVSYSPNGAIVMASTSLLLYAWNAHTGQHLLSVAIYKGLPSGINSNSNVLTRFSPDGTRIALARVLRNTGTISIWDVKNGKEILKWRVGPSNMLSSLAIDYSPDGAHIMSGSNNGAIHIWDAYTGKLVSGPLDNSDHPFTTSGVAYSPDGTHIVTTSNTGAMHVWNIQDICATGSKPLCSRQGKLQADGWVTDERSNLLVWVPLHLHNSLMRARNTLMIGPDGHTQLNFEGAYIGGWWIHCYTPE
ncbi:unnamed protein product [Rhizoctonia solani]|uniref:Nephrocystin 3-like N-terminal domain-containing protein n=1 Tax=Rhizoctonia solani TaxID=456999 RepID=A0A8H3D3Q2_9AGAM|nr:unnamed protein product [Rhizoctonia solani]